MASPSEGAPPTLEEVEQARTKYQRDRAKRAGVGVPDAVLRLSRWLYRSGGEAEEQLCTKCQWEHMTRTAVIIEWGDPRTWADEIAARNR